MMVGDLVTYDNRRYRIVGFDPIGAAVRSVHLEDRETGKQRFVPLDEFGNSDRPTTDCDRERVRRSGMHRTRRRAGL